jgi:hypothetical protein
VISSAAGRHGANDLFAVLCRIGFASEGYAESKRNPLAIASEKVRELV